jgi:thiamine-phosphate diphosphorylase
MPKSSGAFPGAPVLYMVTARAEDDAALVASIGLGARGGIDLIQIRQRDHEAGRLIALTRSALAAVSGTAARIIVNDRLDVALAAGASGVHLRGDSFAAAGVKSMAPPGFLVGRSVHSEEEAIEAETAGGCDYLMFGTVFPSSGKPAGHQAAGVEALARVCDRVRLPIVAIGGITTERAPAVWQAGAVGLAAVSLFQEAPDIEAVVRSVRSSFDT